MQHEFDFLRFGAGTIPIGALVTVLILPLKAAIKRALGQTNGVPGRSGEGPGMWAIWALAPASICVLLVACFVIYKVGHRGPGTERASTNPASLLVLIRGRHSGLPREVEDA